MLATWRYLLDEGLLQRGEYALAGTARPAVARLSAATAAAIGAADGAPLTVRSEHGSVTVPLVVTEMVDDYYRLRTEKDAHEQSGELPAVDRPRQLRAERKQAIE